jgi:hypothetical protein
MVDRHPSEGTDGRERVQSVGCSVDDPGEVREGEDADFRFRHRHLVEPDNASPRRPGWCRHYNARISNRLLCDGFEPETGIDFV